MTRWSHSVNKCSLLLTVALLAGCGLPAAAPGPVATPAGADQWRLAGPPVALVGRPTGVVFERDGVPVGNLAATAIRVEARCISCSPTVRLAFEAKTPDPRYELDPGVAEAISGIAEFPMEGLWRFEPVGGELIVRSPTSTEPPVVVVRPASVPLSATCGPKQVEQVVATFARGFNAASAVELAQALNRLVDFSMTGEPLPTFSTHTRDDVVNYASERTRAGERVYPYLVYAASIGDNAVDLSVYFVRNAPDLPTGSRGFSYRRAFAGSRLFCSDLLLLRFNAALLDD